MFLQNRHPSVWSGIEFFLARNGFGLDETTLSTGMLFSPRHPCELARARQLVTELSARVPEADVYIRFFGEQLNIGVRCKGTP